MLEYVVTGALASDDPWSGGGKGAALTDKREAGSVGLAEVDDHDGVLSQVHLALDGRPGMHQLGTAEVTNEDRVLKSLAVLLHRLAHPSQSFRLADVVRDEVPMPCHRFVDLVLSGLDLSATSW